MTDASIIIIGDEILSGRTQDTNSFYLAKRLNELGIHIVTIGDNKETIELTIRSTLEKSDLIFISGGLGPTPDDKTMISVAKVLKRRTVFDENILIKVEAYFKKQNRQIPELASKQALIPQGAITLDNPVGQAPGLILQNGKKTLILLPGVSLELVKIFETGVVPYLHDNFLFKPEITLLIRTTNIPEMEIVSTINNVLRKYHTIKTAYLPSMLGVDIRINQIQDKKTYQALEKELRVLLKPYIYGYGNETIEENTGKLLRKKQLTLATAESCTGGLISDRFTNIAGSSEYFIGGVVAYSNKIKKLAVNVQDETLKKFGAVSKETVVEMAKGIRDKFSTDIGLSVSGIAGPGGATREKPVGLVFIGLATKKGTKYEIHNFTGDRRMIKEKSAMATFDLLRRTIEVI